LRYALYRNKDSVFRSNTNALLRKAEDLRVREHRLSSTLKLRTKDEIVEFIHEKGLVSALGGNELPSLISAVLGKKWKPSAKGFTGWLDWWSIKMEGQRIALVFGEIERRHDILASRVFRKTKTFVSNKLWPILSVIEQHQRELANKGKLLTLIEKKIFKAIEADEPIRTDELREKLRLEGKQNNSKFHRSLAKLENYCLIIGAEDAKPEKHIHANIWQTWGERTGEIGKRDLSYPRAVEELLEKTLDACVLADENQITKWFSWGEDVETAEKELLRKNAIAHVDSHVLKRKTMEKLTYLR
jgi:hypothetical protein